MPRVAILSLEFLSSLKEKVGYSVMFDDLYPHTAPTEVAHGFYITKTYGRLPWVAWSYFPSRNAQRAWRVYGVPANLHKAIARAINKFEENGGTYRRPA